MKREALLHVLRAANEVAGGRVDFLLIGSQAILGAVESDNFTLMRSMEADLAAMTPDQRLAEEVADRVSGVIGEGSDFNERFGYYADGVEMSTAKLAPGWEQRLGTITFDAYGTTKTARFISPEDLAVSKLLAGREKDLEFVQAMLEEAVVQLDAVSELLATVPEDANQLRAGAWLEARRGDFPGMRP